MTSLRQILFFTLAFAQFATSRFHELSGMGRTVGAMANDAPTPATPAGYAFLIWILIFALWAVCAGYQARPANRNSLLWHRVGWPMVTVLAAGNLWMLTATLVGNGLTLLSLITVMTCASYTALGRAAATNGRQDSASSFNSRILLPTLALTSAWLTLAFFLNLSGAIQLTLAIPTGTRLGAITTLTAATVVGGYVLAALRRHSIASSAYALALIWGLLAVALANSNPSLSPVGYTSLRVAVAAVLCAVAVVIIMACQYRQSLKAKH